MAEAAPPTASTADRWVLSVIAGGLLAILLSVVWGLFLNPRTLPNWAENVLVTIATASALKLGDCLATLVALASGRQVERLGNQLHQSSPAIASPSTVKDMQVEAENVEVRK